MSDTSDDNVAQSPPIELFDDLLDRLERTSDLGRAQAAKVIAEVLGAFGETTNAFVRRRHRELQSQDLRNDEIYRRVASELTSWRVRPPALTTRQIRRIVYG